MSMILSVVVVVLCAVSIVMTLLYMMNCLYTAKISGRWTWRRTEEMILGSCAMFIFLSIIWVVLDLA